MRVLLHRYIFNRISIIFGGQLFSSVFSSKNVHVEEFFHFHCSEIPEYLDFPEMHWRAVFSFRAHVLARF